MTQFRPNEAILFPEYLTRAKNASSPWPNQCALRTEPLGSSWGSPPPAKTRAPDCSWRRGAPREAHRVAAALGGVPLCDLQLAAGQPNPRLGGAPAGGGCRPDLLRDPTLAGPRRPTPSPSAGCARQGPVSGATKARESAAEPWDGRSARARVPDSRGAVPIHPELTTAGHLDPLYTPCGLAYLRRGRRPLIASPPRAVSWEAAIRRCARGWREPL